MEREEKNRGHTARKRPRHVPVDKDPADTRSPGSDETAEEKLRVQQTCRSGYWEDRKVRPAGNPARKQPHQSRISNPQMQESSTSVSNFHTTATISTPAAAVATRDEANAGAPSEAGGKVSAKDNLEKEAFSVGSIRRETAASRADDDDRKPAPLPPLQASEVAAVAGGDGTDDKTGVHVDRPRENDVLFGRGRVYRTHTGNREMQRLVDVQREEYDQVDRDCKTDMALNIVYTLKSKGGRFLKHDKVTNLWTEVPDETARNKVSHAIRDARAKALATLDATATTVGNTTATSSIPVAMLDGIARSVTSAASLPTASALGNLRPAAAAVRSQQAFPFLNQSQSSLLGAALLHNPFVSTDEMLLRQFLSSTSSSSQAPPSLLQQAASRQIDWAASIQQPEQQQ